MINGKKEESKQIYMCIHIRYKAHSAGSLQLIIDSTYRRHEIILMLFYQSLTVIFSGVSAWPGLRLHVHSVED